MHTLRVVCGLTSCSQLVVTKYSSSLISTLPGTGAHWSWDDSGFNTSLSVFSQQCVFAILPELTQPFCAQISLSLVSEITLELGPHAFFLAQIIFLLTLSFGSSDHSGDVCHFYGPVLFIFHSWVSCFEFVDLDTVVKLCNRHLFFFCVYMV